MGIRSIIDIMCVSWLLKFSVEVLCKYIKGVGRSKIQNAYNTFSIKAKRLMNNKI